MEIKYLDPEQDCTEQNADLKHCPINTVHWSYKLFSSTLKQTIQTCLLGYNDFELFLTKRSLKDRKWNSKTHL
jgi:hypothetical protein